MLDPYEGVAPDGSITTGVGRENVPEPFEPLLAEVVTAVTDAADAATVYLYGSVATGQARRGQSDVDLLVMGLDPAASAAISRNLSARYRRLCRGVELGLGQRDDFQGDRERGARRWSEIEPDLAPALAALLRWSDRTATPDRADVEAMLNGPVRRIAAAFETQIGLWA